MSRIKFFKMEGAGNDFVIIDNRTYGFTLKEIIEFTPKLCDRKYGVGADGLLVLDEAENEHVDYTMIYRNADGSDAGMCGNGGRCIALYAATHGFENDHIFNVHDGLYKASVDLTKNQVSLSFPDVNCPEDITVLGLPLTKVYTGTEHVVSFVALERLEEEQELIQVGSDIRHAEALNPPGTNVNFICPTSSQSLSLQTYERGVENLTLACGTGAVASAVATHYKNGNKTGSFNYEVKVKGGTLNICFDSVGEQNNYKDVKLIGPANFVFQGEVNV